MVKHTQNICLSVFDHFVGLALKGLKETKAKNSNSKSNFSANFCEFRRNSLQLSTNYCVILPTYHILVYDLNPGITAQKRRFL